MKGIGTSIIIVLLVAIVFGFFIVYKSGYNLPPVITTTTTTSLPPNAVNIVRAVGEREDSFLIQKINRDSVEGLWYQKYPLATNQGVPKILHIGDDIGYACEGISEKLTNIDFLNQKVTFTKIVSEKPVGGCPICLSGNTLIDTPNGPLPVKDLRKGMSVWSVDVSGNKILATIVETGKTPVSIGHKIVHLLLSDGRELFASPGHPLADGRSLGELSKGNIVDGAIVIVTEPVLYEDSSTYDILPSGDTGLYWANGILLKSTLAK